MNAIAQPKQPASLPLPAFSQLSLEQLEQQVQQALNQAKQLLETFPEEIKNEAHALALIDMLDQSENKLQQSWGILSHLNAVMNSAELRERYQRLLPVLSDYYTQLGQHQAIFKTFQYVEAHPIFNTLSQGRKRSIELSIRDFKLSGVALEGEQKKRFAEISARLSELSSNFSNHVLDATQAWSLALTDAQLAGLPDSSIALLQQLAEQRGQTGALATLDFPSYLSIMTYADDRQLRETVYQAYVTRASELGNPEFDNSAIMQEILKLRHEMATLVGFPHYAAYSLASKMAPSVDEVEKFLLELADKAKIPAIQDLEQLKTEAKQYGVDPLQPWDSAYFSEKIKQREYKLSQEELKPYFPASVAINGLFKIVEKLYGIQIEEKQADVWQEDVRYYEVSEQGKVIAGFYFDLYARSNKRGGAWMNGYQARMQTPTGLQLPVAFMVGNFTPAIGDQPALLSHDELVTLFHEFGHGLHHMLTEADVISVAGVGGVAWDAVELPSQFMEFWTWDREALALVSSHFESGDILPTQLLQALLSARFFQTGLQTLRQIEFALFDLRIHQLSDIGTTSIQDTLNEVRKITALLPVPSYNRFQHSFSHIFAGGYAAGYYSYKWAEVLASDAFDRFEQEGVFNNNTGSLFRKSILAVGGSVDALTAFKNFRGREPSIDALLRHSGWTHTNLINK